MNRTLVGKVLNNDEVRSRVMKDAAFFDAFLGIALGLYFTSQDRVAQFYELVVDRLSFDEKLRVIEKLPLKRQYKSVAALPVVRHVQQARNLIAHEWYVTHDHRRLANAGWLYLFADWP